MYMHRVTVKKLVAPHYQPRNTYVGDPLIYVYRFMYVCMYMYIVG